MHTLASLLTHADAKELMLILVSAEKRLKELGGLLPGSPPDSMPLAAPESDTHLESEELAKAEQNFRAWRDAAVTPARRRARNRLYLAFLLIRHGALRLGEALALNDAQDIDFRRSTVIVHGSNARELLLPRPVMREIRALLEEPAMADMRGKVLALDPGYLRRKFYERARALDLPGGHFSPRMLRHSRAVELMRSGMPLQAARAFLGQQDLNMTAHHLAMPEESVWRMVRHYLTRETKMKTSARNAFTGRVTRLIHDGLLVEVEVQTLSGIAVVAVITDESGKNLRLEEGSVVTATVKAPWVIVEKNSEKTRTSARNRYSGTIQEIKTSAIACEIITEIADGSRVCALITRESLDELALQPGEIVTVTFKPFAVILNAE